MILRWLGFATATLVVATGCGGGGSSTSLRLPSGGIADSAEASAYAVAMLHRAPVPPDAQRLDKPPASAAVPPGADSSPDQPGLTRTQWWRVAGTVDSLRAYAAAHPLPGFTDALGRLATPGTRMVTEIGRDTGDGDDQMRHDAILTLEALADGAYVDVLAVAQVTWPPQRWALETIPAKGATVTLDYTAPSDATHPALKLHKALAAADATRLLSSFDVLVPAPNAVGPACADTFGEEATAQVNFPGHTATLDLLSADCIGIEVTVDGLPQPTLARTDAMIASLYAALGISEPDISQLQS